MGQRKSSRSTPSRPHVDSTVGAFDQSLKYLLHKRPEDFISFALSEPEVRVVRPSEAALPARGRDIDGGYLIEVRGRTLVSHTEFHRRHQELDELALDVAEAQVRLYRRERVPVLSHVWDLYGSPDRPVLEDRELELGAALSGGSSRCVYRAVNLRGMAWRTLLETTPSTLWPLVPLTRDGASAEAVRRTRDAIEAHARLSLTERADRLAVLWFFAEAEDVASAALREYISLEKLMDSELYKSIVDRGITQEKARTIVRILARKLGYLDETVRTRVEAETDLRVLEPWYDDALGIFDDASAERLIEHIRKAPPLRTAG